MNDAPVQWNADSHSLFVYRPGEIPAQVFQSSQKIRGTRVVLK